MNNEVKKKMTDIQNNDDLTSEEKSLQMNQLLNPQKKEKKYIEESLDIVQDKKDSFNCKHYKRNNLVMCSQCLKYYPCRLCHNDVETHELDRFAIEKIYCCYCDTIQKISNKCIKCDKCLAKYYCNICHLFEDDMDRSGNIRHCDSCGFCRLGKDTKHCDKCNMCFHSNNFDNHNCKDNIYCNNCPICLEDIYSSTSNAISLECGHIVHNRCLQESLENGEYRCPLCKKSIGDMTLHWDFISNYVNNCVMPDEFKDYTVKTLCNDCGEKTITKYHFVYNKCEKCDSWNTAILDTIPPENPISIENEDNLL